MRARESGGVCAHGLLSVLGWDLEVGIASLILSWAQLLVRIVIANFFHSALVLVNRIKGSFHVSFILGNQVNVLGRVDQLKSAAVFLLEMFPLSVLLLLEHLPLFERDPFLAFEGSLLEFVGLLSLEFLLL